MVKIDFMKNYLIYGHFNRRSKTTINRIVRKLQGCGLKEDQRATNSNRSSYSKEDIVLIRTVLVKDPKYLLVNIHMSGIEKLQHCVKNTAIKAI